MPPSASSRTSVFRALAHHREFARLYVAIAISAIGDRISAFALPVVVLVFTGSIAQTGLVSAVEALPFLFALRIGRLVDTADRRRVMFWSQMLSGAALASVPLAVIFGALSLTQLYLVAIVEGMAFVAFSVARVSGVPFLLPDTLLRAGIAAVASADSFAQLVGPALGGLIIAFAHNLTGPAIGYGFDAGTFLLCGVIVATIHTSMNPPNRPDRPTVRSGLRLAFADRQLRLLASFSLGRMILVAPGFILVFAQGRRLDLSPTLIGLVFSLGAIGGLVGSAIAVPISARASVRSVSVAANALLAVSYAVLAVAPDFALLLIGELMYNLCFPVLSSAQLSYRIHRIPPEAAGRINALFRMVVYGSGPLGLALGALFLSRFGPVPVLAAVAIGLAGLAVLTAVSRLGSDDDADAEPEPAGPVGETSTAREGQPSATT